MILVRGNFFFTNIYNGDEFHNWGGGRDLLGHHRCLGERAEIYWVTKGVLGRGAEIYWVTIGVFRGAYTHLWNQQESP